MRIKAILFDKDGTLIDVTRTWLPAYREILGKKWKSLSVTSEESDSVSGVGDNGRFQLRRNGAVVTSMEGLEPAIH